MRNSALIIKVPTGSSIRTIRESGINPDDFGATVTGIRKTRAGDVVVDLGMGIKSRVAANPLKTALSEKITGASISVVAFGSKVSWRW